MAGADAADFRHSAAYVARTFIDEKHLKRINSTLTTRWGKLNSLSAAVQLMKAHGVELTPEEEGELATMDEAGQISTLVGKMPPQSNDEFSHFFMKLQVLVQSATALRVALEDGRVDAVEKALDDAEATGIAQYMLKVSVVQAGLQKAGLHDAMMAFQGEANLKMGRLCRGQQDCTAAQKKLAVAHSLLAKKGKSLVSSLKPMMVGFLTRDARALLHASFQGWQTEHQREMMHRKLTAEFKERTERLEAGWVEWQKKQLRATSGTMMKQIQEENANLRLSAFIAWHEVARQEKYNREISDKTSKFEAKLAASKASFKESAKRIVGGMYETSGGVLMRTCFSAWLQEYREALAEKATQQAEQEQVERTAAMVEAKLQSTKLLLSGSFKAEEGALVEVCFKGWKTVYVEAKHAADLAAALEQRATSLLGWGADKKRAGMSCMERAAAFLEEQILLRTFNAWILFKNLERTQRTHQSQIDAKRKQLCDVQNMFREFAVSIESGIGKDSSREQLLDRQNGKGKKGASGDKQMPPATKEPPRLSKGGNSVSLPDINANVGSRPGSGGSRSGAKA